MIVRTLEGVDREIRRQWPDRTVPPRPSISPSGSGEAVTPGRALGLPAFGAAVRMVSGVIAAADLDVFSGEGAKKRERADTWQAKLFDNPAVDWSPFDWLWDIAASLESYENALLQKIKGKGRILELRPLPMDYAVIYLDRNGQKTFEINDGERWQKYTTADILHIRGQTVSGGLVGVSKIMQHMDPIGAMLAAQRFEGAYFRNHARPDFAFEFPDTVTREQASEWTNYWDEKHGGAQNFGKAAAIGGGAKITPIAINMRDAQFIEARQLTVEDIARIMAIPPLLLGGASQRIQGDALRASIDQFMHLQMPPRIERISAALKSDPDLFGQTPLYPEICIDELSFLDPLTRAQVEHQRIQDGTRLVDETRADHGWAPLPAIPKNPELTPGMVPQLTPVGGAPNPNAEPSTDQTPQENSLTMPSVELRLEQNMEPLSEALLPILERQAQTQADLVEALRTDARNRAAIEASREKRAAERERSEQERIEAHHTATVGALERASSPTVTVNVEPTPITFAPVVNIPETPVQLTLLDESENAPKRVTFERDTQGLIRAAEVKSG